ISLNILFIAFFYKIKELFQDKEDILLLLFLLFVWYSFSFGYLNQRSFNHSLSYTFSILFLFVFTKYLIRYINFSINSINKAALYSVITCNIIVVIEWILYNIFDKIIIRDFFLTGGPGTSNMIIYYQTFFWSVGGVGEEPGGTASLVNILFPMGLIALRNKSFLSNFIYVLLHFIAMTFLASVAGMVFLILSLVISSFMNRKYLFAFIIVFLLTALVLFIFYEYDVAGSKDFIDKYIENINNKVTLNERNASSSERKIKWSYALRDWLNSPIIGNGPGYGVEQYSSGYFNTILTLLADTGIFSTLLFIGFLALVFKKIFALEPYIRFCLLASFVMLFLHSSVYYVYYHFPFWLLMIVIQLYYNQKENSVLKDSID
ncbi:MAG: O-antigen ligase family protein, partial [Sediminibacterium sp.]|nr:O-antigen ligase family protein [Sediminibacterium sp.]